MTLTPRMERLLEQMSRGSVVRRTPHKGLYYLANSSETPVHAASLMGLVRRGLVSEQGGGYRLTEAGWRHVRGGRAE